MRRIHSLLSRNSWEGNWLKVINDLKVVLTKNDTFHIISCLCMCAGHEIIVRIAIFGENCENWEVLLNRLSLLIKYLSMNSGLKENWSGASHPNVYPFSSNGWLAILSPKPNPICLFVKSWFNNDLFWFM